MREKTYKTALGGVMCALGIGFMFIGIIPFATYVAPALASLCVMFFVIEYSKPMALAVYAIISILGFFLVPDKEVPLVFIFIFGYYPILKAVFESRLPKAPAYLCKLVCFNAAVIGLYFVATRVFIVASIRDEFLSYSGPFMLVLLALGNLVFVIYDIGLTRLISTYVHVFRKKIFRK